MTKYEIIKNWVENIADTDDLISIVRNVNCWNGSLEKYNFYYMDELDELFYGVKLTDFLNNLAPNFNTGHDGFIESYSGLESCNAIDVATDIRDNAEEVAEYIENAIDESDIYLPTTLENELEEDEE